MNTYCSAHSVSMSIKVAIVCLAGAVMFGCAAPVYTKKTSSVEQTPLPSTQIYYYPTCGQTEVQQDRDRYECYLWAVEQSGFDPGQSQLAPHQRIEVVPTSPPGSDIAVGAASGAVIGSILAGPRGHGEGLVFGIITGLILGTASELQKQEQVDQLQQQYDAADKQQYAILETQARSYRRAISACLEGRSYNVQ